MSDKYEEFKKYCLTHDKVFASKYIAGGQILFSILFEDFENNLRKEERKENIKNIISFFKYEQPYWLITDVQQHKVDDTYCQLRNGGYLNED